LKASVSVDSLPGRRTFPHGPPSPAPIKSGANKDDANDAPLKRPAG
jgi:hypothetical protein